MQVDIFLVISSKTPGKTKKPATDTYWSAMAIPLTDPAN